MVGSFTVLGIAVRQGITLISHYRNLERHAGESFGAELVQRCTQERCAPILMTAGTTALAFLPFVLFGNIAGLEILHPVAIVVLGSLVTATLFTLAGVPAIYLLFGGVREPALGLEALPVGGVTGVEIRAAAAAG
jgi:HME family heavy-metal exporter